MINTKETKSFRCCWLSHHTWTICQA